MDGEKCLNYSYDLFCYTICVSAYVNAFFGLCSHRSCLKEYSYKISLISDIINNYSEQF